MDWIEILVDVLILKPKFVLWFCVNLCICVFVWVCRGLFVCMCVCGACVVRACVRARARACVRVCVFLCGFGVTLLWCNNTQN